MSLFNGLRLPEGNRGRFPGDGVIVDASFGRVRRASASNRKSFPVGEKRAQRTRLQAARPNRRTQLPDGDRASPAHEWWRIHLSTSGPGEGGHEIERYRNFAAP